MSKQQNAKDAQGYIEKPILRICANCIRMQTVRTFPDLKYPGYWKDTDTCLIGDFRVKRQATCNHFQEKI